MCGLISPSGSRSKAILIRKETRHQGNERMPFMKFSSRKRGTQSLIMSAKPMSRVQNVTFGNLAMASD